MCFSEEFSEQPFRGGDARGFTRLLFGLPSAALDSLRVESDLGDDANEQLVDFVVEDGRHLDVLSVPHLTYLLHLWNEQQDGKDESTVTHVQKCMKRHLDNSDKWIFLLVLQIF